MSVERCGTRPGSGRKRPKPDLTRALSWLRYGLIEGTVNLARATCAATCSRHQPAPDRFLQMRR
jgi:hypothetical protein